MKLNINPFNRGNPIGYKDAVIISAIAATSTYVLTFLADASLGQIRADAVQFAYDSVKTWLVSFFGMFSTLTGLEKLIARAQEKPDE